MNRWKGDDQDSLRQSSERSSRAARRAIAQQTKIASESEDEDFFAANDVSLPLQGLNLDGEPGDDDIMSATEAAAELARQRALPVDTSNYVNDTDSWKKEIKLKFNINDVSYWFNSVEADMKKFGINMQWDKKDAILPLLPQSVLDECMPILRLSQDEAGDQVYKDLKTEILSLYGPKEEDAFKKAIVAIVQVISSTRRRGMIRAR